CYRDWSSDVCSSDLHDQSGARSVAQAQQRLAQRCHGARVILVLIVRGVERIQNNDFGRGRLCGGHEMTETLGGAEHMPGGASVRSEERRVGKKARGW